MKRSAFTLVEMTIVLAIIAILVAMALPVFTTAYNQSKTHRTRAIIAKIDSITWAKWDAYNTRPLPIRILPGTSPQNAANIRLAALTELKRLELPETIAEVTTAPTILVRPAISKQYLRRASPNWTTKNESAECLYLIVASTWDNDHSALDWFAPSEIDDVDGDGMNEILDSWGHPIEASRRIDGVLVFSKAGDVSDAADDITSVLLQ